MEPTIVRYEQAGLRIEAGGLTIYIDPFKIPEGEPAADVLFLSHHHRDHLMPEDVARVRTPDTAVFANRTAAEVLDAPVQVLMPGDTAQHQNLNIKALPAYNVNKLRDNGEPFHQREGDYLGFLLTIDDLTFYFAGDTDPIPEMEGIGPVDYAFIPVCGAPVMTAEEAAEVTRIVQPSVAIPVHYGYNLGSEDDAKRFASLVPDQVRVWIMSPAGAA